MEKEVKETQGDSAARSKSVFGGAVRLLWGTGAAQAVAFAVIPFLTRMYSVETFGGFGIFMALTTLGAVLITGRYESAVPLPKDREEAWGLVHLIFRLTTLFCALGAVVALAIPPSWIPVLGREVMWLPLGLWLMSGVTSTEAWLNRNGAFGRVAVGRFSGALLMASLQFAGGVQGWGLPGLVGGFLVGLAFTFGLNGAASIQLRPTTFTSPWAMAQRYQKFPRYLLVAQVFNSASGHLPTVFLGGVFGPGVAGLYTVANRALTVVDLLATAVGQAFYPVAAQQRAHGEDCRPLYNEVTLKLVKMAVVIFPLLFVFSPLGFKLVFGAQWEESGYLARWILPLFFARFIFVPASLTLLFSERQDLCLMRQGVLFVLVAASLGVGYWTQSYSVTLVAYALAYSTCYVLDWFLADRIMGSPAEKVAHST